MFSFGLLDFTNNFIGHIRVPSSIEDDEDENYHNDNNYGNFDDAGGENYQKEASKCHDF